MSTSVSNDSKKKNARIARLSAFFGATLEFYDFTIYGVAAALFFGPLFFPQFDPVSGSLISLATFGAAYVTRPLGAIFWGHVGDKLGRARVLLLTLFIMGVATFLIGCLPTYSSIGTAAPICLVVLRLIQGFSAGGESTGSSSVALEHASDDRRASSSSFAMSGTHAGTVLANGAFLLVALLPRGEALAWGWRIPLLASGLVLVVTFLIRRHLAEPTSFATMKERHAEVRFPLLTVVRDDWRSMVRVTLGSFLMVVYTVFAVYSLSFASTVVKLDKTLMLLVISAVLVIAIATQPLAGLLADKIGRKPVFAIGSIGSAISVPLYFASVTSGNFALIFLSGLALMGVFQAMMSGSAFGYFLEQFPVSTRVTGTGVSMMVGFLLGGFTPAIADSLVAGDASRWPYVAIFVAAASVVAGVAVCSGPETRHVRTSDLDRPRDAVSVSTERGHSSPDERRTATSGGVERWS